MAYVTSPLVCHASVRALLIHRLCDWYSVGRYEWGCMLASLAALPPTQRVMGFDIEWVGTHRPSLVQLATATHCFLFHLAYLEDGRLPEAVQEALADTTIIKCGVGIEADARRMHRDCGCLVRTLLPVEEYGVYVGLCDGAACGLKSMTQTVLDFAMRKSSRISSSNWELELSVAQVAYAADDAVASMLLGRRVMAHAGETQRLSAEELTADDGVAQWLRRTREMARVQFKHVQRVHTAARQLKVQMRSISYTNNNSNNNNICNPSCDAGTEGQENSEATAGERATAAVASNAVLRMQARDVTVLDADGTVLLQCSYSLAKRFVQLNNMACVKEYVLERRGGKGGCRRRPRVIQLLPRNAQETRLCQLHLLGCCPFGEKCPYAHSESTLPASAAMPQDTELGGEGTNTQTTPEDKDTENTISTITTTAGVALPSAAKRCVHCKATSDLHDHAVVPPLLRNLLPASCPEARVAGAEKVPICLSCRGLVQQRYNVELDTLLREASERVPYALSVRTISRCIGYARLLLNEEQCARIGAPVLAEKHRYIRRNWRPEFFVKGGGVREDDEAVLNGDVDQPLEADFLRRICNEAAGRTCHTLMMRALVGEDAAQARQFVQRWRDLGVTLKLLPPETTQAESAPDHVQAQGIEAA